MLLFTLNSPVHYDFKKPQITLAVWTNINKTNNEKQHRACFHAHFKAIKLIFAQYLWVRLTMSVIWNKTKPNSPVWCFFDILLTWIHNPNRTGRGISILPAEKVLQGGFMKPGERKKQLRGHHMNFKSFCLSQKFSWDWHEKWPFAKAKLF